MFLIRSGMFRMDYLMPAELFLVALIGGALLIWAAPRARKRRGFDRWGAPSPRRPFCRSWEARSLLSPGLATGEIEPVGWQ